MPVFFLILVAASLAALANLFIRKNLAANGSSEGYFLVSFACSLGLVLFSSFDFLMVPISWPMLGMGILAGSLIVLMMQLTAWTLTKGPAGLTFAFQTSGSVFPSMILFLLFGEVFGFILTPFMMLGFVLIVVGLFWAAKQSKDACFDKQWYFYAALVCLIHAALLTLFQWRCLLLKEAPSHGLIPFHCDPKEDIWFMPGMLATALFIQMILVIRRGKWPYLREIKYGALGGLSNGVSTSCLLMATTLASPLEKGLLFPLFVVGIILICNVWGTILYSERVHWKANAVCLSGILIASISN